MNRHDSVNHNRPLKNTAKQHKSKAAVVASKFWPGGPVDQARDSDTGLSLASLHCLSRKGLWGLLLFLLASVVAFMSRDFNLYLALPESVLQIVGCPPPATMIHLALTGYSFTIVVPVLIRMANGEKPVVGWRHLIYRTAFYPFYLFSLALPENFAVVVTIGILLYVVEQIGIWSYLYKHLRGAEA